MTKAREGLVGRGRDDDREPPEDRNERFRAPAPPEEQGVCADSACLEPSQSALCVCRISFTTPTVSWSAVTTAGAARVVPGRRDRPSARR